jgi:hypothetical protein
MARVVRRGERLWRHARKGLASLRDAVQMVLDEDGVPPELAQTRDLEVA